MHTLTNHNYGTQNISVPSIHELCSIGYFICSSSSSIILWHDQSHKNYVLLYFDSNIHLFAFHMPVPSGFLKVVWKSDGHIISPSYPLQSLH